MRAIAIIILLIIAIVCLVCAWKYWHGAWLRSIAGNTFATETELRSPLQIRLGKRVAIVCVITAASLLVLTGVISLAETMGKMNNADVSPMVIAASIIVSLVIALACTGVCVIQWRDMRKQQLEKCVDSARLLQDTRLDKIQAVVLIAVLVGLEIIVPTIALIVSS